MTKVNSTDIHGFEVWDSPTRDERTYDFQYGLSIYIENDKELIRAEFKTANTQNENDHDEFFDTLDFARSAGLEVIVAVDNHFNGKSPYAAERKLAERLNLYPGGVVQHGFPTSSGLAFDQPEFVLMLAQCSNHEEFNPFLERLLRVAVEQAEKSLIEGKEPNYRIHVSKLLESLGKYLDRRLEVTGVPEFIAGWTRYRDSGLGELVGHSNYVHAIIQENGPSFTYNPAMRRQVLKLTADLDDDLEKSRAIFDWITSNVKYGCEKRKLGIVYRGASQVYKDREGICGESAALQVTMERLAGNIAFLVEVGKNHVCAAHIRPNGEVVLLDTTSANGFDAKEGEFKILSDDHSLAGYL